MPPKSKTAANLVIPPPATLKRLRSFLGSVLYIRPFLKSLLNMSGLRRISNTLIQLKIN